MTKRSMRTLLLAVTLVGCSAPAFAQLPMGIPDLCAGSPDNVNAGQTLTVAGPVSRNCLGIHGTVTMTGGQLTATTILVYPEGVLNITGGQIVFRDSQIDTQRDPEQFGHGLLCLGTCTARGVSRVPTFVRLASEPMAGQTTLQLRSAPPWQSGDQIVIPDTRQFGLGQQLASQFEERTIASISGTTLTLSQPLQFSHQGARDDFGTLDFLPHVANLSRSVVIRSENPDGVRGHVLFSGRAFVDIEGVWFQDLGRTTINGEPDDAAGTTTPVANQKGRYEVHFHHLMGPVGGVTRIDGQQYQYRFVGNTMTGGSKWAIGIHNSHYGLIQDNVAYDTRGAAFMTEDCSESYNLIESNIALRTTGQGDRGSTTGLAGVGFFFRGPNNYVRNNVVAGAQSTDPDTAYGYKYFQQFCSANGEAAATTRIPKFPGADTMDDSQVNLTDITSLPILQFDNNEVYGATESGLSYWWVGTYFLSPRPNVPTSTFRNLKVWHVSNKGVFAYESSNITIDGLVIRGAIQGVYAADYLTDNLLIENADIQSVREGVAPSVFGGRGPQTIRNSRISASDTGIVMVTPWTSGAKAERIPARATFIENVTFLGPTAISMAYSTSPTRNMVIPDAVRVTDFNGAAGDSFSLFYTQQAPGFVVPQTVSNGIAPPSSDAGSAVLGSPQAGLTNAQTMAKYGIAIGGAIATCTDTRPGITGFACGGLPPEFRAPTAPVPNPPTGPTPPGDPGPTPPSTPTPHPPAPTDPSPAPGGTTMSLTASTTSVSVGGAYTLTIATDATQVHSVKLDGVSVAYASGECSGTVCSKTVTKTATRVGVIIHTLTATTAAGAPWPSVQVLVTVAAPPSIE